MSPITNSAQQPTGSGLRRSTGPNGSAVLLTTVHDPDRHGIRPQDREAYRTGKGGKVHARLDRKGWPKSERLEKRKRSLLEHTQTNPTDVTPDTGVLKVCTAGCGRICCPGCRSLIGKKRRQSMRRTMEELRKRYPRGRVYMWTLTTAHESKYASPQEAHEDITKNERIRKLAKRRGWEHYSWVLEWHVSGWPHWHVLVVKKDKSPDMWAEVQEQWGYHVNYRHSDQKRGTVAEKIKMFVNYTTKYLVKPSESPVPDWILDSNKRIRMASSSRAWSAVEKERAVKERARTSRPVPAASPSERKTHRDAIKTCGDRVVVIREYLNPLTGEICNEFVGRADIPWRTVRRWLERGKDFARTQVLNRHARIVEKSKDSAILHQFLDRHML